MKVNCPTCKIEKEWTIQNTFRPFCSERCKLIDLGEWASESRVIKGQIPKQQLPPGLDPALAEQLSKELDNFDEFDIGDNDFFHD